MLYFTNFSNISYNFGDEPDPVTFQNISIYADIIDQIKDDITFANKYTIGLFIF